ncbi:response regulator transcription factor [Halomonas sp. NyZ770]|uniref:response regulator transcription factor n=1 Tax=Halomonas sp. NyZ770 TaxID=2883106 RepID=UPI00406CB781
MTACASSKSRLPILDDVVKALEQGADDFLAKPLRPKEFLARVSALGRRAGYETPRPSANCPSAFDINTVEHTISVDGHMVELIEREYRLATLFFSKVGELLSRAHLLELVWGIKGDVSTRTVDTHVSRLRRKLELDGRTAFGCAVSTSQAIAWRPVI